MPHKTVTASLLVILIPLTLAPARELTPTAPSSQRTTLPPAKVSVPLESGSPQPTVLVTLNGKGPYRLTVDTGTSFAALIDDDILRELGLPLPEKIPSLGAAEETPPLRLDSLKIGDAEFAGVPVMPVDFTGFVPPGPNAPVGILGLPLFADCLLTFDYPAQQLILERGALPPPGNDVLSYSPNPEEDFCLTIEAGFAGHPVRMHIDTGSPAGLTLLSKWADKLPLDSKPRVVGRAATPAGSTELSTATLQGQVRIGPLVLEKPVLEFADLAPMVRFDCGNIGSGLLRSFAMTVDQKNRRVRLLHTGKNVPTVRRTPPLLVKQHSNQPYRVGVAFRAQGDTRVVDMLVPDGAGKKGGLRIGDVLLEVNGTPLDELGQDKLSAIFGAPDPAKLTIRRGDQTIDLTVTPQRVGGSR